MPLQFAIYTASDCAALIADYSNRVQRLRLATNTHGFAECVGFVPMNLAEAFRLYDRPGLPHVVVSDPASGVVYEGRLEDVNITGAGVVLSAFGYSRALDDVPYVALWSTTSVADFSPLLGSEVASRTPEKFSIDTNNRLFVGLQKNATYANLADVGGLRFRNLDRGSRSFIGLEVVYQVLLPVNWKMELNARDGSYGSQVTLATVVGTGALISGALNLAFSGTPRDVLSIEVYNNTGAGVTYAGETGATYAKITGLRIVTTVANRINTTLGTAIAAGTRTVTPGSMARISVGQRLIIGGAVSEAITVIAVTSTTFTAVFAQAHVGGDTVQAFVVYADEIVSDLVTSVSATNSTQLLSSAALIQSPALDLSDEVYEDASMSAILDRLAGLGDNQTTPREWEWGVQEKQALYFRPQSSADRTWYIDISDLDIERTLDYLYNSVYATYQDANGTIQRTAINSDSASSARYGLTRRERISAQTTSSTQAAVQRDAALADGKTPAPRSGVTVDRVYDASGARWPLYCVRASNTVVIRNLAPTLSSTIDRVRIFRLARGEYRIDDDALSLEPETPRPTLDALLARLAVGIAPTAHPWKKNE